MQENLELGIENLPISKLDSYLVSLSELNLLLKLNLDCFIHQTVLFITKSTIDPFNGYIELPMFKDLEVVGDGSLISFDETTQRKQSLSAGIDPIL